MKVLVTGTAGFIGNALALVLLQRGDEVIGVLDIDSPVPDRFSAADQLGVEQLCQSFCDIQSGRTRFI